MVSGQLGFREKERPLQHHMYVHVGEYIIYVHVYVLGMLGEGTCIYVYRH